MRLRSLSLYILAVGIIPLFVGLLTGTVSAKNPTIRQSPLSVVQTCGVGEYATITYQGIVCHKTTDSWKQSDCNTPSDCCKSGEFLKITPTGLQCYPFSNKTSTYTTYCADCCGASEFAVITTLGLRCAGSACNTDSDCSSPTPYCNTTIGRCVQCTQDSHCSGSNNFCSPTNRCETCSWDSTYTCSNNKRVKHCRLSDGTIKKTQTLSCPNSGTCSNGQCVCTPTSASWGSAPACSSPSSVQCGTTIPNTTASCSYGRTANCSAIGCSGSAPTNTCSGKGTKCATGTCKNNSCYTPPACTNASAPAALTATPANRQCTIAENDTGTYDYRIKMGAWSWITSNNQSAYNITYTNLANGTAYPFYMQRRNSSGNCTTWSTSTSVSCTPTASAPQQCTGGSVSWTVGSHTCRGTRSTTNSGSSATVSNTTSGKTGSATYSCTGTSWGSATNATCTSSGGNNSCSATTKSNCALSATSHNGTSGSCASGYTGSCSYTCSNGTWGSPSSNSCTSENSGECGYEYVFHCISGSVTCYESSKFSKQIYCPYSSNLIGGTTYYWECGSTVRCSGQHGGSCGSGDGECSTGLNCGESADCDSPGGYNCSVSWYGGTPVGTEGVQTWWCYYNGGNTSCTGSKCCVSGTIRSCVDSDTRKTITYSSDCSTSEAEVDCLSGQVCQNGSCVTQGGH